MSALFQGGQDSIRWLCWVSFSVFDLPACQRWGIQCVSIYTISPLIEPAGGRQPAAESPEPGSRGADTASGTVTPTDTHTTTAGGSAARSPPMCQAVSETRSPWRLVWIEGCWWNCSSSGHLWHCGYTQTHTTPMQRPANPTQTAGSTACLFPGCPPLHPARPQTWSSGPASSPASRPLHQVLWRLSKERQRLLVYHRQPRQRAQGQS